MSSLSVDDAVELLLATSRGLLVAAAGCGKTQLIARTVAHRRAGRQLVLTHTHAGVAALRRRFKDLGVAPDRFHLDTIAGWSLKYAAAYRSISELPELDAANPEWRAVYPAAGRVHATALGRKVVSSSYDGVLVDEYQDCSASQHAIIAAVAEGVPVRVVGDPLQAIFGFDKQDPMVAWSTVEAFFDRQPDLTTPHRWNRANPRLGAWLEHARRELEAGESLTIAENAPVAWSRWSRDAEVEACRAWGGGATDRVAAIKRSTKPNRYVESACITVATRLGGHFRMVERFDDDELPRLAEAWQTADGPEIVSTLHHFVRERTTRVGPALKDVVAAIAASRPTRGLTEYLDHCERLEALAREPTPQTALAALEGLRAERRWIPYRPEGIYQLRAALSESESMQELPASVAIVRTRARHRGRHVPRRTLGTTLLLKGLEFDDAIVLNADELTANELYVAVTRGSRSLQVLSACRTISPRV